MIKKHYHQEPVAELLFEGWTVSTSTALAVASVSAALAAVLLELSKWGISASFARSLAEPSVRSRVVLHTLRTFLHVIQLCMGYTLMLVVMTFNIWLMVSVVLGAGLGYLLCGWTRIRVVRDGGEINGTEQKQTRKVTLKGSRVNKEYILAEYVSTI